MNFKSLQPLIIISSLFILLLPSLTNAAPVLTIQDLSDSPDPFSPNADGIDDTTTISATISASGFRTRGSLELTWEVIIRDSEGMRVNKFVYHQKIKNNTQISVSQPWDGRDMTKTTVVNGTYTYQIKAKVNETHAEPKSGEVTVILSPSSPQFSPVDIITPQDGAYLRSQVSVEVAYQGGVKVVELHVDGKLYDKLELSPPFKEGTHIFAWDTTSYADGQHTLQAFGYFSTHRTSPEQALELSSSRLLTLIVDNTPPVIKQLMPAPESFLNLTTPEISAILQDATSGIDSATILMEVDNTQVSPDYEPDTGKLSYTPDTEFADGTHQVELTVKDRAGNLASATWSFIIDTIPPVTSITPGEPHYSNEPTYVTSATAFVLSAVDERSGIKKTEYNIDGNTWLLYTEAFIIPTEGHHSIFYRSTDNAGNIEEVNTLSVFVDDTPPVTSLSIEGPFYDDDTSKYAALSSTYTFTATDAGAGLHHIEVNVDEAGFITYSQPISFTTEGSHSLSYKAVDNLGNWETEKSFTVVVDDTPPGLSDFNPPDGSITNNTLPEVSATAQDSASGIAPETIQMQIEEIQVNPTYTSDTGKITYQIDSPLADGTHSIRIRLKDRVENLADVGWSFIIDTIPPQITIEGVVDGSFVNEDVVPVITITDEHPDTQSITLNGTPFVSGTVITEEGDYTLQVNAQDKAGNSSSQTVIFTIDKTPPEITITGITEGEYRNQDVTPVITIEDLHLDTQSITLNTEPFASGTTITDEGSYTLQVDAQDKAGNQASQTITFTIDKTPPEVTIVFPEEGYITNETLLGVSGEVSEVTPTVLVNETEAIVDTENLTFTVDGISLREGENTITAVAIDLAGNTGTATTTVVLDTTPPSPPTGLTATPGDTVVDLSWDANSESDLAGYNVYRSEVSGGPYTQINSQLVTEVSYQDTDVEKSTTYYYVVTAVDNVGNESGNSEEVSVVPTDTTPPSAPTGLVATAGDTVVDLSWEANTESDLAGYNVYRSEASSGPYNKVNAELITTTTYHDTGLTNGTTYYYVVTAVDNANNESTYSNEVSATPEAWISNVSDSPDAFSPNADNRYDTSTISYFLTKKGSVTIKLYDENNNLVRTLKDNLLESEGANTAIWDGRDDNDNLLADGTYVYTIDAVDSQGNPATQKQGTTTIDNNFMTITEPQDGASLTGVVTLRAIPSEYVNEYKARFFYRPAGTADWTLIGYGTKQSDGNWTINWDTTLLVNGEYELVVGVYYYDLNGAKRYESTTPYPTSCTVANGIIISNVSDSPDAFSPNGDGRYDTASINYLLTKNGKVTINIYTDETLTNLVRTLKDNLSESEGAQTAVWDGTDNSGNPLPEGTYTYTIEAVDDEGNSATPRQGTISIDNHFMTITEPTPGSSLTNQVSFKALPSEYIHSEYKVSFYYRPQGESSWTHLGYATKQDDGSWTITWDTTTVANGDYELHVSAKYYDLNNAYRTESTLPYGPLYICHASGYFTSPTLFSPNGDGVKDTTAIVANFGQNVDWTIIIKDTSDSEVRRFEGTDEDIIQIWDGKNSDTTVVSDGVYTYYLSAVDPATQETILEGSGEVEVDNTPPTANITQPTADSQVSENVEIRGIVDDLHYDGTKSNLSWGQGESPTTWNILANFTSPVPTETTLANWNTTSLTTGSYMLRLYSCDLAGNITEHKVPVDVYNVRILSFSDAPDPFTPDADGNNDTNIISATLSMPLDWTITIKDKDGIILRTFSGHSDSISQAWDGKNEANSVVDDGKYTYTIEAEDPNTGVTAPAVSGTITADTALPIAQITSPQDDDILSGTLSIMGTASDNNFTNYKVEYGLGDSPSSWTLIKQASASVTDGELATWNTFKVENGIYTLRLTVTDVANHISTTSIKVTVDNIKITDVSAIPQFIEPTQSQTSTISFTLDRQADVTIKIYRLDFTPSGFSIFSVTKTLIATPVNNVTYSAGPNSFAWDGKDDSSSLLPFRAYAYTIEAVNTEGRTGIYDPSYTSGIVTLENVTITSNFDPYKNEFCEISYDLVAPAWVNIRIYVDNSEVRNLVNYEPRPSEGNTELWDGRDNSGNVVGTASYTAKAFAQILPENTIVTRNTALQVTSLNAEAYLIVPSYNQISTINYSFSKEAKVTIKIYDPNGNYFRTIQEDTTPRVAGSYSVEWDGANDSGEYVNIEGDYRGEVSLTDDEGNTVTRNGNIVVYR